MGFSASVGSTTQRRHSSFRRSQAKILHLQNLLQKLWLPSWPPSWLPSWLLSWLLPWLGCRGEPASLSLPSGQLVRANRQWAIYLGASAVQYCGNLLEVLMKFGEARNVSVRRPYISWAARRADSPFLRRKAGGTVGSPTLEAVSDPRSCAGFTWPILAPARKAHRADAGIWVLESWIVKIGD